MKASIRKMSWAWIALLLLGAVAMGLILQSVSPAQAQDDKDAASTPDASSSGPPLGDCFGGLLTEDPLHCYALKQAQSRGVIDIEKIYDDHGVLYLSLRDSEVGDGVYQFLKEKSYHFYDTWPHLASFEKYREEYELCVRWGRLSYRECLLEKTGWSENFILPYSVVYENILFHVGGESGRRKVVGWASWRQVWPASNGTSGARSPETDGFAVSDVDLTNFPEYRSPWSTYPEDLEILGVHSSSVDLAFQVKSPPEDQAKFEAAKQAVIAEFGEPITFVPVKYIHKDLWRWAIVLHRFALSAGNTIGITSAGVTDNRGAYPEGTLWPLDSLRPPGTNEYGNPRVDEIRNTIEVWSRNPQQTLDALPVLLPQLGIPVDAVGIVPFDLQKQVMTFPSGPTSAGSPGSGPSVWTIVAVSAGVALAILGSLFLFLLRRRAA